jgi:hypothetical protein
MEKFRKTYRISSTRARWSDYKDGMYFVTVCTAGMNCYFGDILDGKMHLNEIGAIVQQNIEQVMIHYPYVQIPLYVVMPNHFHAIVIIDGDSKGCRDIVCNVSTSVSIADKKGKNEKMSQISPQRGSLATVIRGIKSATTRYANAHGILFAWQARFHDRIIRNSDECNRIAEYIENNPSKWDCDEFNRQ